MEQNTHELLSKSDVIREYRYPEWKLREDLAAGRIQHFRPDGWGRFYIPRWAVEARIAELVTAKTEKTA